MSRRLGLIIGTNQYQDPTFRPLRYAENDARALAQWLVNNKGGQWKPTDVQHLHGTHATKQLVESLAGHMCLDLAEAGDTVLIYFSGHIFLDERSGDGYLALYDTHYQSPATGLSVNALIQQVWSRCRATHKLLIVDGFQSGRRWASMRSQPFDSRPLLNSTSHNRLQQQHNQLILCSCRGNEMAPEVGEQGLGLFMHRLIVGLSNQAHNSGQNLSLRQLHGYLFESLHEQQRPQLFGSEQPSLVLTGEIPPPNADALQYVHAQVPHSGHTTKTSLRQFATTGQQSLKADTGKQQAMVDQHREQQCQFMLEQARQLLQAQQWEQAYGLVEQVLQISPSSIPALTLQAQLLGSAGHYQEALDIVEQLLECAPNDPIAWSMQAVVLSNLGDQQNALAAIDHSLQLESNNPETHEIKRNIQAQMFGQNRISSRLQDPEEAPQGGVKTFFSALGLQLLGFVIGIAGAVQPILYPKLPIPNAQMVGIGLMALGLLILTANAARASHRYGFSHFIPGCLMSVVAGLTLAAIFAVGYNRILAFVNESPEHNALLAPILFLGMWLIVAAAIPFIAALGGLISGTIARAVRGRQLHHSA
jgi:tetratricopeptide (TPR) repeat protein